MPLVMTVWKPKCGRENSVGSDARSDSRGATASVRTSRQAWSPARAGRGGVVVRTFRPRNVRTVRPGLRTCARRRALFAPQMRSHKACARGAQLREEGEGRLPLPPFNHSQIDGSAEHQCFVWGL